MAKSLKDILAGQKKSKVSPPDIDDKNLYQWNGPDGVKFIKKHEIENHDYPHDAEAAFRGKKGGSEKTTKYKFQKDGVYEASCNQTNEGVMCEVHGEAACPTGTEPKDMKKGKKVLLDKKIKEEAINEVAPKNPKIEKWIKSNKERFVKEYGKEKGMQVLYAKAWKMHGQSESGTATNTDYTGPGAAGYTTGRLDVGTL